MISSYIQSANKPSIIIEGPDGTGKTTLAQALVNEHNNLRYEHLTYMEDPSDMYWQFIEARNKLTDGNVILDRYIISNKVYSYVCDNIPVYDQDMFYEELQAKLTLKKTLLIFCLPEDKEKYLAEFNKLCKERDELVTSEHKMSKIFDAYTSYFDELKRNYPGMVMRYDRFLMPVAR